MRKLGFATFALPQKISKDAIVLDPFAERTLQNSDRACATKGGIVVIDCSWVKAGEVFMKKFKGQHRKLPALIAGNPTNYAKIWSLSSVEAAAASLYIMNFREAALQLLTIYKWGQTFLSLNQEALDNYSNSVSEDQIRIIERSYYPQAFKVAET
jgi:pre-rRNA-processing protein TSR3